MFQTLRPLLALALMLPTWLAAKDRPFVDEPRPMTDRTDIEEPEYWKEGRIHLPPYPPKEGLQPFQVDAPGSVFHYAIDPGSLSIGADGVVRYALVIESNSGARNVSYEGMRCDAQAYKTYAYGNGGRWTPLKAPEWHPLSDTAGERYRYQLYTFYLCDTDAHKPYPPRQALQRMRRPGVTDDDNSLL